jgi:hypothetical protein
MTCEQQKDDDCASASFLRSVDRPRIVTQEKGFSEDYFRVHRFQWGTPLDDPNELVPNFNRYVIRAIARRSIIPQTF